MSTGLSVVGSKGIYLLLTSFKFKASYFDLQGKGVIEIHLCSTKCRFSDYDRLYGMASVD